MANSQTIVYTNRAPSGEIVGGLVRVILDSSITTWIAPACPPLTLDQWHKELEERSLIRKGNLIENCQIYTYPVPQQLYESHYKFISNKILWPIFHSVDTRILTLENEESLHAILQDDTRKIVFPHSADEIVKNYLNYLKFCGLSNMAVKKFYEKDSTHDNLDRIRWIHDYQAIPVDGEILASHTPIPSIEYLKRVEFNNGKAKKVNLLDTLFFRNLLEHWTKHKNLVFQRPNDVKNFLQILHHYEMISSLSVNKHDSNFLQVTNSNEPKYLLKSQTIRLWKNKLLKLSAIPVGIDQRKTLNLARENENRIKETHFTKDVLEKTGIYIKNSRINVHELLSEIIPSLDGDMTSTNQVFISIHRNDYSKNTIEKLEAIDKFFKDNPETINHVFFLLFLQPTRTGIKPYEIYQNNVISFGKKLHEKYGNSLFCVPAGIKNCDFLGLLRHREVLGIISTAFKDGHDLTVRETIDSRADCTTNANILPLTAIVSDGIGASVLFKNEAFIVKSPIPGNSADRLRFIKDLSHQFSRVLSVHSTKSGREQLADRYRKMVITSNKYNSKLYTQFSLNNNIHTNSSDSTDDSE
ncbi:hypothetical protein SNEBB_009114 [Seison nebaliae]|nr:hypothetical protein SNEBB_009114 [Seison nebaliae]